jgi:glutamine amidotransferase
VDIVICDVGLGNLRSVERALAFAASNVGSSARVHIETDPNIIRRADKVVMPGQGAFRDCAAALDRGLGEALREVIARGVPYLGICLGLQVLFGSSEEARGARGLGIFPGEVVRLRDGIDEATSAPLKIPHIGWNVAEPTRPHPMLPTAEHFYFVHSYAVAPAEPSLALAHTQYGHPFVSAVAKDNVVAVQFHPEKSQHEGIRLLERFVRG